MRITFMTLLLAFFAFGCTQGKKKNKNDSDPSPAETTLEETEDDDDDASEQEDDGRDLSKYTAVIIHGQTRLPEKAPELTDHNGEKVWKISLPVVAEDALLSVTLYRNSIKTHSGHLKAILFAEGFNENSYPVVLQPDGTLPELTLNLIITGTSTFEWDGKDHKSAVSGWTIESR